jgi:nitrogen-specific signal transduction histidine kinase
MGGEFAGWILGSMSSGILAIDASGALAALNQAAQRTLGLPEGDPARLLSRDCREVLAGQPALARLLLDTLAGRGPLSRAEIALEATAGGPARALGFTLSAVRDAGGAVRGAAMIFRDLAPIERQDEQARLRERLAALGQMAAGLAHEIRNPLAGMEVLAGLLRRRLEDRPEERGLVEELLGELRAVAGTVAASLEFVRPVALARAPLDPVRLLEEALATAASRMAFEGEIERCYAADLPRLLGDPDQLRGVLVNLIVNAFEAMDGAGRLALGVEVRVSERPPAGVRLAAGGADAAAAAGPLREVVIAVGDSGPGIPDAYREKVFYPFFTTKERGSGVGLASAQKVVASHGGAIELASKPGRGACFRVHLPAEGEGA